MNGRAPPTTPHLVPGMLDLTGPDKSHPAQTLLPGMLDLIDASAGKNKVLLLL